MKVCCIAAVPRRDSDMISRPVVKLSYVVHVSQCTRQTQLPVQEPLYTKMLDGHCTVYSVQYTLSCLYMSILVHVILLAMPVINGNSQC